MTSEDVSKRQDQGQAGCRVVILHENEAALSRAMQMCDRLMAEVWRDWDLKMDNWPIEALVEEVAATDAANQAGEADVVVIAAGGNSMIPETFAQWAEQWLACRQSREGALVGLFHEVGPKQGCQWDIHLHGLALRAGMDYLRHLPNQPTKTIPDVTGWCATRAETYTGTLDQIIRTEPKPLGL